MNEKVNRQLDRLMPIITPTSVAIGVLNADHLHTYTFLVPWIFAYMTFTGSLGSTFQSLKQVVKHPQKMITTLIILHILMPIWALGIGNTFFSGDPDTITGVILAAVIPTGITSFIWVSIYRGNIAMALSIILVDTLLSPFIVPSSISLMAGESVAIDVWGMMKGLVGMVVLPSLAGMFLNELSKGRAKDQLGYILSPFSKIGLAIVVMVNSSVVAPSLLQINTKLILIAVVALFVSVSGYFFSLLIGRLLKWEREDVVTIMFTGGMRNISAGAVLAVTYFQPPVAIPVVIGMLFQQVLASLFGHFLHRSYQKSSYKKFISQE
jgi:bile acid:Na+ symporter, BASS family